MGRPRKRNPKNKHIGFKTTEEKYRRFKALGLVGDEVVDILLFHLEKDKTKLQIEKSRCIRNIKNLRREIENLEFEILKEETRLSELNEKIGVNVDGVDKNVERCVHTVLQRFNMQETYSIREFLELKVNKEFLLNQAYLCSMELDDFKDLIMQNV